MGQPPKAATRASFGRGLGVQRLLSLAYAVFLSVVSLAPGQRIPKIFDWSTLFSPDKLAHFGAYAIFAVLLSFSIGSPSVLRRTATAVVAATLFGVLMEVLQGVIGTGRDFDPVDMVANLLGAVLGGIAYLLLTILLHRLASARP
ncbi:VanZ family protein [Neolewinella maritima]|uniref:VanZ family protein n=1 Tax=Neolewinella maritima TaxID=1383882 RepID=UPI001EE7879A|nr:VanZ family protein [Neolewinella maritima]